MTDKVLVRVMYRPLIFLSRGTELGEDIGPECWNVESIYILEI